MPEPAVTALVTNHDYAEFLTDALDSVLAQEYPGALDVLVVDDGSTDRSLEVLAGYGDRIRVIRQDNRGQLLALRAGLAASTGDIVCLLDADDAWAPERVARVVDAFADGSTAWVANGLTYCDARLRPIGVEVPPAGRAGPVPGERIAGAPVLYLERRAGTATSGLALRRDLACALVDAVDALERDLLPALRYDADRILLALIGALRRPGRQLALPLTYYRRHGRQQFAGERRQLDLLDRQIEVDLMAARVMDRRLGWSRVPTIVPKHRLVASALRREPGRWRLFLDGLGAAARLLPRRPVLAARQAAALTYAWLAPRRWLARLHGRYGGP